VLKSAAVSLGEIAISSLVPDEQQLEEVKRQTAEFIAALPRDSDNRKVLVDGGEDSCQRITLDEEVDKKLEQSGRLNATKSQSESGRTAV
jgi:hypothetical protein